MMNISHFKSFDSSHPSLYMGDDYGFSSTYEDGVTLVESANYVAALRFLDDAIAHDPTDYQAWTLRGVVLVYLGRYEDAIASCDRALTYQPNHSEAWKFRGLALHALNRYREAHLSYERALGVIHQSFWQKAWNWLRQSRGESNKCDCRTLML